MPKISPLMKKVFLLFFLVSTLFLGCDDGDLIVTDFDFDSESNLQLCNNGSSVVLYVINKDPSEAIAVNFSDVDFDGTFVEDEEQQELKIPINQNNQIVYRSFKDPVSDDYYCRGIPDTEPVINNEYRSKNGGNLYITTTVIKKETDSLSGIVTKTFETYAEARDLTLKNTKKDEEIVKEQLQLGSFTRERTFNSED